MGSIKVCSLLFDKSIEDLIKILHIQDLPFAKDFVYDDEEPDYLFANVATYIGVKSFKRMKRLFQRKNMIRIFCPYECASPDLNLWDYAITSDRKLHDMDRISHIPSSMLWFHDGEVLQNDLTVSQARALLRDKSRFCCFLYTNGLAHPMRDRIFHAVSSYKRIESLGRHLNNVNTLIGIGEEDKIKWGNVQSITAIKSHYKFSIASENATYEGYTSEKLLTSFMAHTVPIYWGNPYVAEEYNPEAFINCNDYDSLDGVVKRVKEIDENDDLWAYMVSQPFQTESQRKASQDEYECYRKFMVNIFSQPLQEARRRPEGYWPGFYERRIMDQNEFSPSRKFFRRVRKVLKNPKLLLTELRARRLKITDINDFFKGEKT